MPAENTLRHRLGRDDRLIETLGYRPGAGAVRAGLHAARMQRSAAVFGFPFDRAAFDAAVSRLGTGTAPLRLRLTLDSEGRIEAEAARFAPPAAGTVWRIAIARTRLDSHDPLLQHKTTRRAAYETARAEFAAGEIDEVLLLNERGEVCEGTLSTVFVDNGSGALETPPLSSGLLAGVLRRHLLDDGKAVERVLMPADLVGARALYLGNSLRGLVPARLQDGS